MTGYTESVETRLRETELARATEAARAVEARKRQRVTLMLAASVLLSVGLGAGGWVHLEQQRVERQTLATQKVNTALNQAQVHQSLAAAAESAAEPDLNEQLTELTEALRSATTASELAGEANVDPALQTTSSQLLTDLQSRIETVQLQLAELKLQDQLDLIRLSQAGTQERETQELEITGEDDAADNGIDDRTEDYLTERSGEFQQTGFDLSSAAGLYEQAFRDAGHDLATMSTDEAVVWIKTSSIQESVISALDNLARVLSGSSTDQAPTDNSTPAADRNSAVAGKITRRKLLQIVSDADSNEYRKQLRTALVARDIQRLKELADAEQTAQQSPAIIAWLGAALRDAKESRLAANVLLAALDQFPDDFWLNCELSASLAELNEKTEAIGYARAALAIRPLSVGAMRQLSAVLGDDSLSEQEVINRRILEVDPDDWFGHDGLGRVLQRQGRHEEAMAEFRRSTELNPAAIGSHRNLIRLLDAYGTPDELETARHNVIRAYRKAVERDPTDHWAYFGLGYWLREIGDYDDATLAFRKAAELNPGSSQYQLFYGHRLKAAGDQEGAIVAFRKAIEVEPKYSIAYTYLANTLRESGRADEAIATLRNGINIAPRHADFYVDLGNLLSATGNAADAVTAYRRAVELKVKSKHDHRNIVAGFRTVGRLDEAIAIYQKAIELDPDYLPAYDALAAAQNGFGNSEDAVATYRRAINVAPDNPETFFELAYVLNLSDQVDAAISAYRTAIELKPDYLAAYAPLADLLKRSGKNEDALRILQEIIEVDPQRVESYTILGELLISTGQQEEGVAEFHKAIELDPKDFSTYERLADALKNAGSLDKAAAALRRLIEVAPQRIESYTKLGELLINSENQTEGLDAFRKAIALDPKNPARHFDLGYWLKFTGKLEEAIQAFRSAAELKPDSGYYQTWTGNALNESGDLQGAIAAYRNSIEFDPKYFDAYEALADALEQSGKQHEAIDKIRELIEADPQLAEAYATLGNLLMKWGQDTDALTAYRKAVELKPESSELHYQIGLGLRDAGDLDEAITAFAKAIDLNPASTDAHWQFGYLLGETGNSDAAIAEHRRVLELDPRSTSACNSWSWLLSTIPDDAGRYHDTDEAVRLAKMACDLELSPGHLNTLGVALLRSGQLDAAREALLQSIKDGDDTPLNWWYLAAVDWKAGRNDEATQWFRKCIEYGSDSRQLTELARFSPREIGKLDAALIHSCVTTMDSEKATSVGCQFAGDVFRISGQLDEAVVACRRAIELDPQNAAAHVSLGHTFRAQNKPDDAIAEYRKAMECDPENDRLCHDIAKSLSGDAVQDNASPLIQEAVSVAQKACDLAPQTGRNWATLGVAHYRNQDWEAAAGALKKAVELGSDSPRKWLFLASAYWQLDRKEEAHQWYEKAVTWESSSADGRSLQWFADRDRDARLEPLSEEFKAILLAREEKLKAIRLAEELRAEKWQPAWKVLKPTELKSNGAELKRQPDGSIFAGPSSSSEDDLYSIVAEPIDGKVVAIRLEAITDDSLPNKGPGRHPSGNFHLWEVQLFTQAGGKERITVPLNGAAASYGWQQREVARAIDGDLTTEWHVWSRLGQPHDAVFVLEKPVEVTAEHPLLIELHQRHEHALGRFRLSFVTEADIATGSR